MFPEYYVIALYAIIAFKPKIDLQLFYVLCTFAVAGHILIIATHTGALNIITLATAIIAICNQILTNNRTLYLLIFTICVLIASCILHPLPPPNINLHIIISCMLGAVSIIATIQAYCILVQNHNLKQATSPEENLLPLTMLGQHLKNTAKAGFVLTSIIIALGFYNMNFSKPAVIKMALTIVIWLIFALLISKKNIIKISLAEKSFLMTLSVVLSIATCIFCIYLG